MEEVVLGCSVRSGDGPGVGLRSQLQLGQPIGSIRLRKG